MIARIELGTGALAELLRLLPLLGLEPVPLEPVLAASIMASDSAIAPDSSAPVAASSDATAVALRVEFGLYRGTRAASPTALTIAILEPNPALEPVAETTTATADFVCASPIAAACFILARALHLVSPILTANPRLFDVIRAAVAIARSPAGILVEGEIGVGKESLIKLIHAASGDPASLIYAECAGLEAASVAAEIAPLVTQAVGADHGVGRSYSGTIFFNHLGELSLAAQRNLLDLIHASAAAIAFPSAAPSALGNALRLLAASTQPLAAMVARGEFLAELHQLFDATLTITPLRDRPGDLPMLVRHALRMLNPALTLDPAALRTLARYPFPGNLRELTNFVTRIAIVPAKPLARHPEGIAGKSGRVGRAEVIRQLDHPSLKILWRSRTQAASALRPTRRPRSTPALGRGENATPAGVTDLELVTHEFAQVTPEALRLTTAAVPRHRQPRGAPKPPA
jgi:transcriptional regulator with AAA-type ATPase domain